MFLTESFYHEECERKMYNWGQFSCYQLKHKYNNPYVGEVKTYKLSKEELEKELKRIYRK